MWSLEQVLSWLSVQLFLICLTPDLICGDCHNLNLSLAETKLNSTVVLIDLSKEQCDFNQICLDDEFESSGMDREWSGLLICKVKL